MGPGQKSFVARVRLVQVGSAIFGLGLVLENFALTSQIFQFFALWVKKISLGLGQKVPGSKPGWSLIYCGSKVCVGRAYLYYNKHYCALIAWTSFPNVKHDTTRQWVKYINSSTAIKLIDSSNTVIADNLRANIYIHDRSFHFPTEGALVALRRGLGGHT